MWGGADAGGAPSRRPWPAVRRSRLRLLPAGGPSYDATMIANPGNVSPSRQSCVGLVMLAATLAGCDGGAPPDESGRPAPPPPESANVVVPPGEDVAALADRARAALANAIRHAGAARLSNVRAGSLGAVCGEVAQPLGGGRFGQPLPFLVTRGGVAMVSSTPNVNFRDPDDLFPDVYVQMCASPAELTAMVAEMDGVTPVPPPPEPFEPPEPSAPPGPDLPPPPVYRAAPPPSPARPAAPAPTGPISNFSDAVMRPDQRR
jgi:hypothetical protein